MIVMYQIVVIFVYEDSSYIGVTYIEVFRIRHGVVEVLALQRYLVFGYRLSGTCVSPPSFKGRTVQNTPVTLEDRTDGCPKMSVSCYQLKPRKIPEKRRHYIHQFVRFKINRTAGILSM
jgi:hypothetical protein